MIYESKGTSGVYITGTGCVSALGTSLGECMANMFGNVRNPAPPTRFSTDHSVKYPVFEVSEDILSPLDSGIKGQTLTVRFALAAVSQALEDAGIDPDMLGNRRVGVCMGTTVGCALNNDPFYIDYKEGRRPGMKPIHRFLDSNPAACVARHFNLSGPVQTIVNACASGTDAIGVGASWIKAGICDLVIAGGTDELCKVTYNGFISLMITDHEPCRPFDRTRNGLNLGEGAGAVILQPEAGSHDSSAAAKCRVAGYASACDAYHLTAPAPDGRGLKRALQQAVSDSGLELSQIGFVNAHGTGTRDNDKVEGRVLSELTPGIPFFSTKGHTGHTLGAAGALEAVFTIQHLMDGRIPASMGFSRSDDELEQAPVQESTSVSCRAAVSQSVAFGGNNSVLVFSRV